MGECVAGDELFVLLKGKNFITHFIKPSKKVKSDPPSPETGHSLQPHLPGQKRERLRRKRLARDIEEDRMARQ